MRYCLLAVSFGWEHKREQTYLSSLCGFFIVTYFNFDTLHRGYFVSASRNNFGKYFVRRKDASEEQMIEAEVLIPAVLLPPWMAVVPRSSNVVAEPQLAVKTIHGCIVLTTALRGNKGDENRLQSPYRTHSAKR